MKRAVISCLTALLLVAVWVPTAHAEDPTCKEIRKMLVGKTFVAKEPLYDTKIDNDGIVDLERDKQEIPVGAEFTVLKVECEGNKLEIKLREVAEKKKEAVEVSFKLSKAERKQPDAMEQFQTMMDYVWEDVPKK